MEAKAGRTVYVDGVFDLFHAGHVAFLAKARALGGRLVVGVITDGDAQWKRRPVMTHPERVAVVAACRHVDEVITDPPLVVTIAFMDRNGLDVAVHGDDDRQEQFFGDVIAAGRMEYVRYSSGPSTTAILARIAERTAAPVWTGVVRTDGGSLVAAGQQ